MPINRYFSSIAAPTTLTGGMSNVSTAAAVLAVTGFPTSYPYTLSIDYGTASEELVDVTNASGLTLTVTRGVDGTSAQSHSPGAVVRHVSSGRDFADFQAHAAATAAVHGVAGTLVGTSDTQTLANKTLTNPTVNGGALSGTLSGAPTLSGNLTFSGAPVFSGAASFTGAPVFQSTAGVLSQRAAAANAAWRSLVTGDTSDRWSVGADGKQNWGSGAAVADTTLYRNTAGELKTDGAFTAVGAVQGSNLTTGAWAPWTPVWTTNTGLHTPLYGNAVTTGTYAKFGRMLVFSFGVTFGSTTNFGSGVTTADNWVFSLPAGLTASASFVGTQAPCGYGRATQSAANTAPFGVHIDTVGTNLILDTAGGMAGGGALPNFGSLDSLTPWTWANGNVLQFFGIVETTT